jgi:hypothetical protein
MRDPPAAFLSPIPRVHSPCVVGPTPAPAMSPLSRPPHTPSSLSLPSTLLLTTAALPTRGPNAAPCDAAAPTSRPSRAGVPEAAAS